MTHQDHIIAIVRRASQPLSLGTIGQRINKQKRGRPISVNGLWLVLRQMVNDHELTLNQHNKYAIPGRTYGTEHTPARDSIHPRTAIKTIRQSAKAGLPIFAKLTHAKPCPNCGLHQPPGPHQCLSLAASA